MAPDAAARLVVDNRDGADPVFAAELTRALRGEGFEVEVREPNPGTMFDTTVHAVYSGVAVRAMDDLDRRTLDRVAQVIRESERRLPQRRRFRAVPIHRGEDGRALRWVDIFESDAL